jgi:transcriptional regulator with XRE-family HTH domain
MVARTGRNAADVAETRSPVLRRRELGAMLRALRAESGMTVEQVAERLLCSPSKVSRLETGQRGASARDIRDLSDLYQVDPAQREYLAQLAREGRSQAWWQPYDLPYATYVGLEAAAVHISDFEPGVFPGLLQIPDYARAVHESGMPRLSGAVIDRRIEERQVRQKILTREDPPPPRLQAIIDEAVLHRLVGGSGVMSAQVQRVIEACELPNVSVQILPFHVGAHPALDSTFIVLEFEEPVSGVVYVEGLVGQLYLERPPDVERYREVFQRLSTISLGQQESLELLARVAAGYPSS